MDDTNPNNTDTHSADPLVQWLVQQGLGKYADVLRENDVDLEVLHHLSDGDLKELGLSLGHRRKLLAALGEAKTADEVGPRAEESPPQADEALDRRQISVVFCDLVGSTALSQQLDPEEMREVMRSYHDAAAAAIKAQEGHVAKLLGDGVLAYFGWPQAHEAQVERAIRAGLAVIDAVKGLDAAGTALSARVGIASGPVVIGDMVGQNAAERGGVVGETPNLAARLQDIAGPGQVVINETTLRLGGGGFEVTDIGQHTLKGFNKPIGVWRVDGVLRSESRFEMQHGQSLIPFVGRKHEIGLLMDRWQLARGGEGQVVLLSGEAGIGKSRILFELADHLRSEDIQVLRYQCSPHDENAAMQPMIAELENASGIQANDDSDMRLEKLKAHLDPIFEADSEALSLVAGLLGLADDRHPAPEFTPQRRKQLTIEVLTDRISRLSAKRPTLLLVEDVHWIDPSSLEAFQALVERSQNLPVLMIMTHRPEFTASWSGFGHVTYQSLNRLGKNDGKAIAERVAGGKALPPELLDHILKQTDGIPLFVEELTKAILEEDVLEEHEDSYELKGSLPALNIPATLQDSLMARLDRLAPVKRVVQAAACIGRSFDVALLSAAVEMTREELDEALEQLLAAQLIFKSGGGDQDRYIFKHALVQDAAYASMLLSARRNLHARLADLLEATQTPDPLELARHYLNASNNDRAASLYFTAGRRSLEASALPEAIGALELAMNALLTLDQTEDRDRRELNIRVALGAARMANFGWAHPSVSQVLEPAFPLAKAFGDEDALQTIMWGLWVHYQTRTDFPRAHEWLAELKTVARESDLVDLSVVYDMSAGCQYFWEADYPRAIKHTDRLRQVYQPERHQRIVAFTNHDPLVFAQHWAGSLADWIRGYPDQSIERMEEALDLARAIGHPFNLVFALTAGATSLIYLDRADEMLALCDEAAKVAEEEALGPFSEHVNVMQWRGGAHAQRGDYEQGYKFAKQGNDFWNASGGRVCNAMFRSWVARSLNGLGRSQEALTLTRGNIDHCRTTGDRYMEPENLRLAGAFVLAAPAGDRAKAQRFFTESLEVAREQGAKSWELRAATSLAHLLHEDGQAAEARATLEPILSWFTEGQETADLRNAQALLNRLS